MFTSRISRKNRETSPKSGSEATQSWKGGPHQRSLWKNRGSDKLSNVAITVTSVFHVCVCSVCSARYRDTTDVTVKLESSCFRPGAETYLPPLCNPSPFRCRRDLLLTVLRSTESRGISGSTVTRIFTLPKHCSRH